MTQEEMISWLDTNCLSFSIERNRHAEVYAPLASEHDEDSFASQDDRRLCMAQDKAWSVRVYPDTPVGFYCVAGSHLDQCLSRVIEAVMEERKGR
ncbi:MAG: hypothetical protein U5M50_04140 [Sphingobium sp.]|nr:hypothetical protein [Sphingobium sp.]